MMIFLDTHVVVWLYMGLSDKLSDLAKKLIENNDLVISPIVLLELQFLHEIKRLTVDSQEIFHDLQLRIGLNLENTPFSSIIHSAYNCSWTRDPFDRLIVAHANSVQHPLLTKDERILANCTYAKW